MDELSYKDEIEALRDDPEFEAKGDELYLSHEDDYADVPHCRDSCVWFSP